MIIATKYYYYCLITTHQSTQYIVKCTSNCDIKAKNQYYILEETFHYFLNTQYVYKKKHHKDCALLAGPIVVLSIRRFCMKFFRVFPWGLSCMQVKLVSALENKEQLIRFRGFGKNSKGEQTE